MVFTIYGPGGHLGHVTQVCGTVSSMLSGLKTRSLGLNTLGTTLSPASSQSVQVGRPSTASWVQPVLSKVNVTCSRPQRNVHRPGFEPGTPWSEIRHPNHCATPPPVTQVRQSSFRTPYPRRLHIKFGFDRSSGFGDLLSIVNDDNDGWMPDHEYPIFSPMSLRLR